MSPQSHVPSVPCPLSPMSPQSHVPSVPCPLSPMSPPSHVPSVPCPLSPMSPQSHVPSVPCPLSPMSPQSHPSFRALATLAEAQATKTVISPSTGSLWPMMFVSCVWSFRRWNLYHFITSI